MAIITVAEPNTLVRLGLLNMLQTLDRRITTTGLDYTQLFQGPTTRPCHIDLMLLSVPDAYGRVFELVTAAQQGYAPRRILLLSDTPSLSYSLLNLPGELAGYLYKHSSQEVLKTSVMLVLAGGKCFPYPDRARAAPMAGEKSEPGAIPKRRWYDSGEMTCEPSLEVPASVNLLSPSAASSRELPQQPHRPAPEGNRKEPPDFQALTPERITREACILQLTPRQYEVLAMLAQGYPLKKVSRELDISLATAKTHAEALYQRLGVNNRNAAVYTAISRGATFGWREPPAKDAVPRADGDASPPVPG
ncbi:response regulator transcription factor [Castellaniella sp.]|uniref:response regulator transcription factor n=1 Tax=Castellaniella sp. TaxID=1955812 RepID=UPI003C758408